MSFSELADTFITAVVITVALVVLVEAGRWFFVTRPRRRWAVTTRRHATEGIYGPGSREHVDRLDPEE